MNLMTLPLMAVFFIKTLILSMFGVIFSPLCVYYKSFFFFCKGKNVFELGQLIYLK